MSEFLNFLLGVVVTVVTVIVKDAVTKNTHKHKIEALSKDLETQMEVNSKQDAEIRSSREENISLKIAVENLRDRFDEFHSMHQEEMRDIKSTMKETTKSIASLDATLQGLGKWLERVERKLESNG